MGTRLGVTESEYKDLLSSATKESKIVFENILYKEIDDVVAMGSPLRPSLVLAYFNYHEQSWLDR